MTLNTYIDTDSIFTKYNTHGDELIEKTFAAVPDAAEVTAGSANLSALRRASIKKKYATLTQGDTINTLSSVIIQFSSPEGISFVECEQTFDRVDKSVPNLQQQAFARLSHPKLVK